MQIYKNLYPTRTDSSDAGYPSGKAIDAIAEGTGTPATAAWVNDFWGAFQAILDEAGAAANATPEKVGSSQILDALKSIIAFTAVNRAADVADMVSRENVEAGSVWVTGAYYAGTFYGGGRYVAALDTTAAALGITIDDMASHDSATAGIVFLLDTGPSVNVLQCGAKGIGLSFDDTPFFKSAIALAVETGINSVLAPCRPVYYHVGDAIVPNGMELRGTGRKRVYYPTALSQIEGAGYIVLNTTYAHGINFGGNNTISNINFHGNGADVYGVGNSGDVTGLHVSDVSFCGYIGAGLSTNLYLKNSYFTRVHTSNNTHGVRNTVDCHFADLETNANILDNIRCETGANDSTFSGTKSEWAGRNNWNFFQAKNISITGGITDRAGEEGFKIVGSEVTISTAIVRRSGRFSLGTDQSAHFGIESASSVVSLVGIITRVGPDDGGGGDITPDYGIAMVGGAPGHLSIVGGDWTGHTVKAIRQFADPTIAQYTGARGIPNFDNSSPFKIEQGFFRMERQAFDLSVAGAVTFTVNDESINDYSRESRVITLNARNTVSGTTYLATAFISRAKELGAGTLNLFTSFQSRPDLLGKDATDDLQITYSNIATDLSSYDITVTFNGVSITDDITGTIEITKQ